MLQIRVLKEIWSKHWFYVLIFIYLLTRLFNLMALPVFNDEAIWIDWGNKLKIGVIPLFYSLYDGKPPLHFVLISLIMRIFEDPLFAGRLISVLSGLLSVIAIKNISREYFGGKYQFLPVLIYIFSPMYLFYDRQSLQESLLSAEICWILYFTIIYFKNYQYKYLLALSVMLVLAFMTKVSALVLLPSVLLVFAFNFVKYKERQNSIFVSAMILIIIFLILNIPLLSQKQAGLMFSRNDRYALTINELNINSLNIWIFNLFKTLKIYFWYFNTLLLSFIGLIFVKNKVIYIKKYIILISLLITIPFLIVSSRGLVDRYVIPYSIPIIFILAGGLILLINKIGRLALVILAVPILMSVFQIFNVDKYLMIMNKYAKGLDMSVYMGGFTSGYGVDKAIEYIKTESIMHERIYVGVRLDAGNPESAIMAYFFKKDNYKIIPVYFDQLITTQLLSEEFIGNYYPFYFVSRDDNLGGMNKYLMEIKRYYKPDDKSFVGIYKYVKNI